MSQYLKNSRLNPTHCHYPNATNVSSTVVQRSHIIPAVHCKQFPHFQKDEWSQTSERQDDRESHLYPAPEEIADRPACRDTQFDSMSKEPLKYKCDMRLYQKAKEDSKGKRRKNGGQMTARRKIKGKMFIGEWKCKPGKSRRTHIYVRNEIWYLRRTAEMCTYYTYWCTGDMTNQTIRATWQPAPHLQDDVKQFLQVRHNAIPSMTRLRWRESENGVWLTSMRCECVHFYWKWRKIAEPSTMQCDFMKQPSRTEIWLPKTHGLPEIGVILTTTFEASKMTISYRTDHGATQTGLSIAQDTNQMFEKIKPNWVFLKASIT